jgi:quercetin dioxygenase-like cupin family protein
MRGVAIAAMLAAGCGHGERKTTADAPPTASHAAPARAEAEGALEVTMMNLEEVTWPPQEADTPKTMRIAVLEGAFPFGPEKAFTALIEFDPGVDVPPHSHPTRERITVLTGSVELGTGREPDRSKAKALSPGALILIPPGQPHWGSTGSAKTLLYIHGVGPHNDPRAVDPSAAAPRPPRHDPAIAGPVMLNATEAVFGPPLTGLPAGASIAVLEGDPRRAATVFTLRVRLPAGARMESHTHPTHERMVVLSGRVSVRAGGVSKEMRPGGIVLVPAGRAHELVAAEDTVVQLQGLGPLRFDRGRP